MIMTCLEGFYSFHICYLGSTTSSALLLSDAVNTILCKYENGFKFICFLRSSMEVRIHFAVWFWQYRQFAWYWGRADIFFSHIFISHWNTTKNQHTFSISTDHITYRNESVQSLTIIIFMIRSYLHLIGFNVKHVQTDGYVMLSLSLVLHFDVITRLALWHRCDKVSRTCTGWKISRHSAVTRLYIY